MPAVSDQIAEKFRFHQGELEDLVAGMQAKILKVNKLVFEVIGLRRTGLGPSGFGGRRVGVLQPLLATQQTLNPRDQNGQVKWLRQVVIGTRFESLEHIFRAPAGS